jgi:hypothetical protein
MTSARVIGVIETESKVQFVIAYFDESGNKVGEELVTMQRSEVAGQGGTLDEERVKRVLALIMREGIQRISRKSGIVGFEVE